MMIFGDVREFAIQAEVEPELVPPSAVWGRMCVWCRGTVLGDFRRSHCELSSSSADMEWNCNHLEELWDVSLAGLDDSAAFAFLDAVYFGDDERTDEQINADSERYARFNFLTNWGEQFDGWKAFMICPPGGPVRILYRLPTNEHGSGSVAREIFRTVVKEFVRWFGEQAERFRA
jgi:hypothetical protein